MKNKRNKKRGRRKSKERKRRRSVKLTEKGANEEKREVTRGRENRNLKKKIIGGDGKKERRRQN